MKKTFTLFLALALVSSLFAVPVRMASPMAPKGKVVVEAGQNKKQVKKPVRKIVMESSTTFSFASDADTAQVEDGVKLTIAKATGQSAPAWNTTDAHLRVYAKNTLTISGEGITNIELTWTKGKSSKDYADLSVNVGDLTSGGTSTGTADEKTDTWEGEEDEVVFTLGAAGQRAIKKVVVTLGGEPIVPKDTIDITINNVAFELDNEWYDFTDEVYAYVYGGDSINYFEADMTIGEYKDDLAGTYTQKDMDAVYAYYNGDSIGVKKVNLVVNEAEGMNRTAKAEVLSTDTILYVYDLRYVVPEKANDTVYVNMAEKASVSHYSDGDYYFYAAGKDTIITLDIYTENLVGEFTEDEIDINYSNMWVVSPENDTTYVPYYTIQAKVVEEAGMYKVTTEMFGYDTTLYVIYFEAVKPAASRTENLTMTGDFIDYISDYGMWAASGTTADNLYALDVYMYAEDVEGSWTMADLYSLSVTQIATPDTTYFDVYEIQSMTTALNAAEDTIVLAASFLGYSETEYVQFNITMACPFEGGGGEEGDTVYITSMDAAMAYYYYDSDYSGYYWDFELYTDSEDGAPTIYWMAYDEAASKTAIAGEYEGTAWAFYVAEAGDTVSVSDDAYEDAYMTISYNDGTKDYTFAGEFVAENGKTYIFNVTVPVSAYDYDNQKEITLDEGGVTPPTPSEAYTVAEAISAYDAKELAKGDEIAIKGYITCIQIKPDNFSKHHSALIWISDTQGSSKDFELYNSRGMNSYAFQTFAPYAATGSSFIDATSVTDSLGYTFKAGDFIEAYGKIKKYNTTYELDQDCYITSGGSAPTGLKEALDAKQEEGKMILDGHLYIRKNDVLYNAQGQVVR